MNRQLHKQRWRLFRDALPLLNVIKRLKIGRKTKKAPEKSDAFPV
jgi:hypothetical protein